MRVLRFLILLVVTIALGGAALGGSVALLWPASRTITASASPLPKLAPQLLTPAQRSYVYDRNGNLLTTLFDEDRSPISLKDIPIQLQDAVIAIEDRRFYEHNGVDVQGSVRALFKNIDTGGVQQGGSTITQQLVKNTLSEKRRRDIKTKAREGILAMMLENELTKKQILEQYLNVVYFGNGAYGVQAASERYFDKQPKDLTLGEEALLAGLIQSPEALNPVTHPDAAARRRAAVIDAMLQSKMITNAQARLARLEPLPTKTTNNLLRKRDYFLDEVVTRLLNDDPRVDGDVAEFLGPTTSARYNAVFKGGLKIYTTFDPLLQYIAYFDVNNILPVNTPFTAALVALDNTNGAVRAMVGGRNFEQSQFNLATEGSRQAGSAFKVITLAAALSAGYSPNDRVSGANLRVPLQGQPAWNLHGDCHGGTITLTSALAKSDNCAFVRTELSLGPGPKSYGIDGVKAVIDMARKLGIDTSRFQAVPSTTLGTNGVSPLDMAGAYSVIAQDGIRRPPMFITKIVGANGKIIYQDKSEGTRVLTEQVARTEAQMMTHVITEGTARGSANIGRPAAGKTGTTDQNVDAWFVGFTPQFTTAVWMGHPEGEVPMRNVGGITVQGATYPARIWARFMKDALKDVPPAPLIDPDKNQLPTAQNISETGRKFTSDTARRAPPKTTIPEVPPTEPGTPDPNAVPTTVAASPRRRRRRRRPLRSRPRRLTP